MADRPRNDDWWLASDGKWYPPTLRGRPADPDATTPGVDADGLGSVPQGDAATSISVSLTNAAVILLSLTVAAMIVTVFFGVRFASELRDGDDSLVQMLDDVPGTTELAYTGWMGIAMLLFAVTGVVIVTWLYQVSQRFDARGASGRRWRRGWTIGAWFVPFANLVIPKLVVGEIEKIAQVPYAGVPIEEEWKTYRPTGLAGVWWAAWIVGSLLSQMSVLAISGDPAETTLTADAVMLNVVAYALLSLSGIALAFVLRRILMFSQR